MRYQEASLSSTAAASVLASYTRMFVAGKRSWLDVLNAARELIQSEVTEGDILAAYWGSRYRLRLDAMDDDLIAADVAGNSHAVEAVAVTGPVPETAPGLSLDTLTVKVNGLESQ